MSSLLPALAACLLAAAPPGEALFVQVAPELRPEGSWRREAGAQRAVVLIHGLKVYPFGKDGAGRAVLRDWQRPGSALVKALAAGADVYAFAYSQEVALEEVAESPSLRGGVRRLRALGYGEVVLVGYSAGGVIARQLVEDDPGAGVTKVVQVCAPNAGSGWAKLEGLRPGPKPFLHSLTKGDRREALRARSHVRVPDEVEFVCVVGTLALTGDAVVSTRSQWPDDLQAQGVPVVAWPVDHLSVMRSAAYARRLAELAFRPQPRWEPARAEAARRALFGEGPAGWLLRKRERGEERSDTMSPRR